MANTLSVKLSLDAAGYKQGIQECTNETKEYTNSVKDIRKELPNARKEFAAAKRDVTNLSVAISQMTEAQRESASGRAMIKMLQDAEQKAAALKDTIDDANARIKILASDTFNMDAAVSAFNLVGNTLSGVMGTIGLVTGKQEDLNRAVAAFTTVQSVANGLVQVSNLLNKDSQLMLGITTIQQKLRNASIDLETASKSKNIIVTKSATVAQWALNAAADANPYVLLASALVALGVALYAYTKYASDAAQEEEARAQALERLKEREQSYAQTAGNAYGELRSKYEMLRSKWNELRTDQERNEFLKENKKEIDKLTDSVHDAASAEDFFNNKTKNVVKSFELRAKAAAAAALAVEQYKKSMEMGVAATQVSNLEGAQISREDYARLDDETKKKAKAHTTYTPGATPGSAGTYRTDYYTLENLSQEDVSRLSAKGITLRNKEMAAASREAERLAKDYIKQMEELEKEANELNKPSDPNSDKNKPPKIKPKSDKKDEDNSALARLEKRKKELEQARKELFDAAGNITDQGQYDKLTKDIEGIDAILKKAADTMKGEFKPKLTQLKEELKELENTRLFSVSEEDIEDINKQIREKKEEIEQEEIRLGITVDPDEESMQELEKRIQEIMKSDDSPDGPKLKANFEGLGEIAREEADKALDEYNRIYNERKRLYELLDNGNLETDGIDKVREAIDSLTDSFREAGEEVERYNEISANLKEQEESTEKAKQGWQEMTSALSATGSALRELGADSADQVAKFLTNTVAMVQAISALIPAKQAEAMASGNASAMKLPFPANIAAWATTLSTILAVFASLPKFAGGGIVGGSFGSGDKLLARVNSGEMIFNTRQQKNLFDLVDSGKTNGQSNRLYGDIVVRGSDLHIAMTNYDKIHNRAK